MNQVKMIFAVIVAVIVFGALIWAYGQWRDYQELKNLHQMTLQNAQAYKDSSSINAAKVTILASQVHDLKAENKDLKSKLIALQINTQALIESLKVHGSGVAAVTDSTADVNFEGSYKIAHYSGETHVDLLTKISTWKLSIGFDPIETQSVLFKDSDGLWKLKTVSRTDGVLVKGLSAIDDDTFNALQKYQPPELPKNLGLSVQFGTYDFWSGAIVRVHGNWYVNANYRFTHQLPRWIDNTLIGVSYFFL